ncbi:hypothetical protein [Neorhizobium sp. JUb45]|uniref:hypothetical protein n=1 Tax=Neorhizobium sp. JUb45 TaxID=2485113 RepID=UPI0010451BAB|nr:hypothetical protein [Neorhizobium sp. JUb45]TCR07253.1 hypothetical protein EDF70_1011226 [Neorhizobium sp. JUb45]
MIVMTVVGSGMAQLEEATIVLGTQGRARRAYSRAINHTGDIVRNEAGSALSAQTGLPNRTGKKAYRISGERAKPDTLTYVVNGQGGDIALKYFKARETKKGVSAAPRNARRVFASTFMKAGWWPKRVGKPNWNKQVFIRQGDGYKYNISKNNPFNAKRERMKTNFRKVKSGVFVPQEMVQGLAAEAWRKGAQRLQPRVEHEVRAMTKGIVS